jgi:hydrogenase nickel incorporation protein HypA/HybF
MHELALVESMIELVAHGARRERMVRVTRVLIEIGAGACVDPDALRFCFPIAAADTVAASAELVINQIPLHAKCDHCDIDYTPETLFAPCPSCGRFGGRVTAGREMRVVSFHGA